jgi:hypothetical protein
VRPALEGTQTAGQPVERTSAARWPAVQLELPLGRSSGSPAAGGPAAGTPLLALESLGPGGVPEMDDKNAVPRPPTGRQG